MVLFCRDILHVTVSPHDITSTAHCIRGGDKDKSRPIIVRFTNKRERDEIYSSKMKLKGLTERYFISEHLSKTVSELLFESRRTLREKKLVSMWPRNGQVHVRFTPDPTKGPTIVKSRRDLIPPP